MLKDVCQNPFPRKTKELFSIFTGTSPCEEAISDLKNAQKIGKKHITNLLEDAFLKIVIRSFLTHYHV